MKHKKKAVIILFLLFLILNLTSINASNFDMFHPTKINAIIFVDRNNINRPWKGSVFHPYKTIEDAYEEMYTSRGSV